MANEVYQAAHILRQFLERRINFTWTPSDIATLTALIEQLIEAHIERAVKEEKGIG